MFEKHFLEGSSGNQGIEHELALLFLLGRGARREVGLGKMIAPFLVKLDQAIELGLEVVHWFAGVLLGGGVEVEVRRGLGRISRLGGLFRFVVVLVV